MQNPGIGETDGNRRRLMPAIKRILVEEGAEKNALEIHTRTRTRCVSDGSPLLDRVLVVAAFARGEIAQFEALFPGFRWRPSVIAMQVSIGCG